MNITLSKQQEVFIRDKLSTGIYESEDDAVNAGLNLLMQHEDKLHQDIVQSLEDVRAGKSRPFNNTVVSDLKAALQKRLNSKQS